MFDSKECSVSDDSGVSPGDPHDAQGNGLDHHGTVQKKGALHPMDDGRQPDPPVLIPTVHSSNKTGSLAMRIRRSMAGPGTSCLLAGPSIRIFGHWVGSDKRPSGFQ